LDSHRTTRRKVHGSLAAGAGALFTYTAIGTNWAAYAQDETYELTWATNNLEGTEPEMLQKVTDMFVAANPNYKVTVLKYDGTTYDQKLLTDIVAGTLPDLFVSADVYTKPFFDSNLTADLKPLAEALRARYPAEADAILDGNARRVIEARFATPAA
jgi:ABC-type glycerol-3-phosphate transport system substrate-binding protein